MPEHKIYFKDGCKKFIKKINSYTFEREEDMLMDTKTYLKESERTMNSNIHPENVKTETLHGIIGVTTEAGELLGAAKKALFYGRPIDLENVREEIGDILWYLAAIIRAEGWTFEELMEVNIAKLKIRYPKQFTTKDAFERKDKKGERYEKENI